MPDSWAERVKEMRAKLKLNQQHFAGLLGVAVMTVSRWENGLATPRALSALVLNLLSKVIDQHSRQTLIDALRRAGSEPADLVRMLVSLDKHG